MTDIRRIEDYITNNLRVDLSTPVSQAEFAQHMQTLGRGQLFTNISDELFAQMSASANPPTMREFPPVFLEAVRRLDGRIISGSGNIAALNQLVQQPPVVSLGDDSTPKVAFRPMEITGLPVENPSFEFSQGGNANSASFADFRSGDVVLTGLDPAIPLQVSISNPLTGRRENGFTIDLAKLNNAGRVQPQVDISDSGRKVSLLYQAHLFRSASEYNQQLAQSYKSLLEEENDLQEQLKEMRSNIQILFPSNVVNYSSLQPVIPDSTRELNNNNNFVKTARVLSLGSTSTSNFNKASLLGQNNFDLAASPFANTGAFNQPPMTTTTTTVTTSGLPQQMVPLSSSPFSYGNIPTEPTFAPLPIGAPIEQSSTFAPGIQTVPMNLSPFQQPPPTNQTFGGAAFGAGAALGAGAGLMGAAGAYQSPYGSYNARWNSNLQMIRNLAFGVLGLSLFSCFSRAAFLPLIASLFFLIWFEFKDDHDLHVSADYFLGAFGVALILELVWLFWQSSYFWSGDYHLNDRSHSGTDKLVVLFGWILAGLLIGIIYFLYKVRTEGIYVDAVSGKSETVKKPALSLMV